MIGAPFYVMERLAGEVVSATLPAALDTEADRRRMGEALVDGLVTLHDVDWRAAGLDGFGRPDGYLERQLRRFGGLWESNRTRDVPAVERVGRWLGEHMPDSPPATIVHGDYRLGNVMFAPSPPPELVAIFDWEMSTIGDPLADLGYLCTFWVDRDDPPAGIFEQHALTRAPGWPTRAELVARYEERSGRALDDLRWYRVMALWKIIVFMEGNYRRGARRLGRRSLPDVVRRGDLRARRARRGPHAMSRLTGKVALVTGAAGGLGRATARALAAEGATVIAADIDAAGAEAVAEELGGHAVAYDVADLEANRAAVAFAQEACGGLDLVHLNAGVASGCGVGEDFDLARYRRAIGTNLDGVVFGAHAALPALRARGGGAIVATASLAGLTGVPHDPIYAANKHAVVGLVRSLAPGLAEDGIRLNAVCPGYAESAIIAPIRRAAAGERARHHPGRDRRRRGRRAVRGRRRRRVHGDPARARPAAVHVPGRARPALAG